MANDRRCPYDPELQADFMLDLHDCPVCGCSIFAGLPHGVCLDTSCMYYSVEGARVRHPAGRQLASR